MLTPEFLQRMTVKRQAEKATELTDDCSSEAVTDHLDDTPQTPLPTEPSPKATPPTAKTRPQKAADTRVLNQHGRSRQEIDDLLRREYREKGPTLLAQELGMKKTAVMMRARRMGLSADPELSVQRRVSTRQKRRESERGD